MRDDHVVTSIKDLVKAVAERDNRTELEVTQWRLEWGTNPAPEKEFPLGDKIGGGKSDKNETMLELVVHKYELLGKLDEAHGFMDCRLCGEKFPRFYYVFDRDRFTLKFICAECWGLCLIPLPTREEVEAYDHKDERAGA